MSDGGWVWVGDCGVVISDWAFVIGDWWIGDWWVVSDDWWLSMVDCECEVGLINVLVIGELLVVVAGWYVVIGDW